MAFADDVIEQSEDLETNRKYYRMIEQLEAAVTSIPMNFADGKGRDSRKEYFHFLHIARGSLYETSTLLAIFHMREWVKPGRFLELEQRSTGIAKMLNGLINSLSKAYRPFLPTTSSQLSAIIS